MLVRFTCGPEFVSKLESQFTLNESVIRFLVVHFDERDLRLESEQEVRNQEALRAPGRNRDDDDEEDDGPPARGRADRDDD